jgi:hypothetical protein
VIPPPGHESDPGRADRTWTAVDEGAFVRRIAVTASLLACTLLVTAVAHGGAPRLEQKRLRPADMALAKRTTLRASDLTVGWNARPPQSLPRTLPRCPGADLDFSAFTITGQARSKFEHRGAAIESYVEVFVSRSDAAGDFRKGAAPKLLACLGPELRAQARKAGVPMRILSSRLVGHPSIGDRALRYRIMTSVATDAGPIRMYVDLVAFQRGRTVVALFFTAAAAPVRGQLELARAVARRTR